MSSRAKPSARARTLFESMNICGEANGERNHIRRSMMRSMVTLLRVSTKPARKPDKPKSFANPHTTWTRLGSYSSRANAVVNGGLLSV